MNNLTNTAKKLDKVFEIAHIVFGALAIASIVGVALIAVAYVLKLDPTFIGTNYESFDIGFIELQIAENYAPNKWLILAQAAFTLLVSCRLFYDGRRGIGYIREILKPMTEEKPFDSIVSTNLKKLAKLSIVIGILYNIIILSEQIMAVFVYSLPGLLICEKIAHVGGMFQVDLTFLVYWAIALGILAFFLPILSMFGTQNKWAFSFFFLTCFLGYFAGLLPLGLVRESPLTPSGVLPYVGILFAASLVSAPMAVSQHRKGWQAGKMS